MRFEIDTVALGAEIMKRKGVKSFEMLANEIGVTLNAVADLALKNHKGYNNLKGYIHICSWLGVSLYKFIKIEGAEETIGTADKYKQLTK